MPSGPENPLDKEYDTDEILERAEKQDNDRALEKNASISL